jgi:xylulokinase
VDVVSEMTDLVSLGIDLGTSELKAVLLDGAGIVVAQAGAALSIARPQPGWSEQDPEDWWRACISVLRKLKLDSPATYARIRCIGLSGQMHGAVLIDRRDRCIRPAILWNDSRAIMESAALAQNHPSFSDITGSRPMAGFTAPKLMWLKTHEPDIFAEIDCVLSPKDYLRLKLTGDRITDVSDAAGTLWLDVGKRRWYEPIIQATGLELHQLPRLVESTDAAGQVNTSVATMLGMYERIVVAGGGGDNPASGVGIGAVDPGHSFITLGTSAAVVSITDRMEGNAAAGVHSYCHALPGRWYAMGAILSGASCLKWITRILAQPSEHDLVNLVSFALPANRPAPASAPLFLPYLSGERTPHNDPLARGGFMNLAHDTSPAMLGYAVLEGVGFALRDAMNSVESAGAAVTSCSLVGGGARSAYWAQLLSNILDRELRILAGSELSASIGAAKLGFSAYGRGAQGLYKSLPVKATFVPEPSVHQSLEHRYDKFRGLFPAVQSLH